jgi:hypothetical protein
VPKYVLVEDGDIGHEDVTTLWVEQWAADIYRDRIAHQALIRGCACRDGGKGW